MMNFGKVSVVMSVYNGADYLSEAIDSIINQTYKNIEIIIVNDGSTDNSEEIIESYRKCDSRIIYIKQSNQGLSVALNNAIAISEGQWIARMDADDVSSPTRIERQLTFLAETGADICGSSVLTFGYGRSRVWKYPVSHEDILIRMYFNSPFAHPSVIGRSFIFKQYPYKESGVPAEDYELWERILSSGKFKAANCSEELLRYRVHDGQISSSKIIKQQEMRSDISKIYWKKNGYCGDFESVVRFSSIEEIKGAISFFSNKYGANENIIISDGLANMIIRSRASGPKVLGYFLFKNPYINKVSVSKKLAACFVFAMPDFVSKFFLKMWFKFR